MNYTILQNKYSIEKHDYPDIFEIIIYYLDDNSCQINVKRLNTMIGWGLLLELKVYDINEKNSENILFGNSETNTSIKYFKTNSIQLYPNKNKIVEIPSKIEPRNEFLISNKYEILKEDKFIDFNICIYYVNEYKIRVIIRRLDNENGWKSNIKIVLHDNDVKYRKEIIIIYPSKNNFKYLFINTKIKVYPFNNQYKQEIPKIIFQTGNSKKFKNILHFNSIISFIEFNPEYTYIYFDNNDCRRFLKNNFSDEINYAYDLLVPGAFKADLIRYCFLYNMGGCYFDCKQIIRCPIRYFLKNDATLILCNDIIKEALLNAVIFSTKSNIVLEKTIKDCVYNIIQKKMDEVLNVTGPLFFYKSIKNLINNENIILQNNRPPNNFNDYTNDYYNNNITFIKNKKIVLNRFYKGYYNNYLHVDHYGKLWEKNEIYYKNFQISQKYKFCVYPNDNNCRFFFNKIKDKIIIKRIDDNVKGWDFHLKILVITPNYEEHSITVGKSNENTKDILISL
jgi:mannosyltransferase OCH1-like enzyme